MLYFILLVATFSPCAALEFRHSKEAIAAPSASELARRRTLNIRLCGTSRRTFLPPGFNIDSSVLPPEAEVYMCEDRLSPHAGALYITNFLFPEELHEIQAEVVNEQVKELRDKSSRYVFHPISWGESDGIPSDLLSAFGEAGVSSLSAFRTRALRITGLSKGYSQIATESERDPLLHHDHNGDHQERVATCLAYAVAPEAGGHTIFPFLGTPWSSQEMKASETNITKRYGLHPTESANDHNAVELTARGCRELQDADEAGTNSEHFGIRPVPGDAILFWHYKPRSHESAIKHFHAGCPARGIKSAMQIFAAEA